MRSGKYYVYCIFKGLPQIAATTSESICLT